MAIPVIEGHTENDSGGATVSFLTLTKPADVEVGDFLLIIVGDDDSGGVCRFSDLANWTKICHPSATAAAQFALYWRIADGTENATINVNLSAPHEVFGWYIRISGADTTTPIHAYGSEYVVASNSSHPITQVTTTIDDCLALYCLSFDGGDGAPFSVAGAGWSEVDEANSGTAISDASGCWGKKEMASQGGAGTATVSSAVADGAIGIQFAIAPAVGVEVVEGSAAGSGIGLAISTAKLDVLASALGNGIGVSQSTAYLEVLAQASGQGIGEATVQAILNVLANASASGIGLGTTEALLKVLAVASANGEGLGAAEALLEVIAEAVGEGIGSGLVLVDVPEVFGIASGSGVGIASIEALLDVLAEAISHGIGNGNVLEVIRIVPHIRRRPEGYNLGKMKPVPYNLGESLREYTLGERGK